MRAPSRTPASRCATPSLAPVCRSSKCTCPTLTHASRFAGIPISRTSQLGLSPDWAHSVTRRPCAPPRSGSQPPPEVRRFGFSAFLGGIPGMDIRKIKKLIEVLEESGIAEIEIKEGEEGLRISRMPAAATHAVPQVAHVGVLPAGAGAAAATASAALAAPESAAPKPRPNEHVITAPMGGTFYASPSPGAKAFVEI